MWEIRVRRNSIPHVCTSVRASGNATIAVYIFILYVAMVTVLLKRIVH